ncbi:MAG: hypothetical protein AMXMBFR53_22840 [Gemmatimonadota bacterium]
MSETREFHYRWSWELPAGAEALWPLVSDTNRFNRDAGLPPVEDARAPGEELDNARRRLRIRVKGVLLEWEELPFEWIRPWRFGVVRRYARGPLEEMRVLADLEPLGPARTLLTYRVAARPRGLLGVLTTPLQIGLLSRITFGRTFRRYAAEAATPPLELRALRARPRVAPLARRLEEGGVDGETAALLAGHVVSSDDMTLTRIRPYELARLWSRERRTVLVACMRATRLGILDLSWDILCPSCRGTKDSADTLRELRLGIAHCDTCRIDFSPGFDQSVELTFHPSPAVRRVERSPFCVAGPQTTPHVVLQQLLAPGEERTVSVRLEEGRHRLRALGVAGGPSFLVEPGGDSEVAARLESEGWGDAPLSLSRDATLRLVNALGHEALVSVERTGWGDTAATAAEVTALPEFRDLFTSEVLAVGAFAQVGSLAILFTDLRDSTALYARVGDPAAFGRVMRHFQVLGDAVNASGGTVVKTIGDAVMAVFPTAQQAVEASLVAQARLATPPLGDEPLTLKAGVHFGPAIAVTLNDRLDYFGTTVNVAARLGALSSGRDVVLSERVWSEPPVRALLEARGATVASSDAPIRGLEGRMAVWRAALP